MRLIYYIFPYNIIFLHFKLKGMDKVLNLQNYNKILFKTSRIEIELTQYLYVKSAHKDVFKINTPD